MDEIKAKHKKEIKTFESEKRGALKKVKATAGKGKKGKEKVEIAEKEWDEKFKTIQDRHAQELSTAETDATATTDEQPQPDETPQETPAQATPAPAPAPVLTKQEKALAKKLRKKKAALEREKKREEEIAHDIANAPNPRQMEIDAMRELYLKPENLDIEEVAADGNCLYRAVASQLAALALSSTSSDYSDMRRTCADKLLEDKEEYEPFADLTDSNVSSFEEYIEKVRSSSEWGGHLELRALASALNRTIVVYSADSAPLYIGDNGGDGKVGSSAGDIRLSFHRKYYALGEHYNAVVQALEN